ncbi:MAG: hypothetical protein QOJ67_2230 [Acidimicrobiaceae bacterium]
MTPATLALASVVAAMLLIALPLRFAFPLFVGSLILVPDTMRFPFGPSDQLPLVRVLPAVFLVGLVLRVGRGEVAPNAFRPSGAHIGLIGFATAAWVLGVAGARNTIPPAFSRDLWLQVVDQIVVLVGAVAAVRTIGSLRAARSVASVVAVSAVIAVGERVTGNGYAEWAFRHLPDQREANGGPLERRGGQLRPRVATRFALGYAWQATMALPVVVAVALQTKRAVRLLAVPLVVAAIAFTSTRSAYLGILVAFVLFAVLSGRRQLALGLVAILLVGGVFALGSGLVDETFSAPEAAGSTDVRLDRAPLVLDIAAAHPVTGSGYGSLLQAGLAGTDSSLLQTYAELGALGLAAVGLSLAMALAAIGPAFTGAAPLSPQRLLAAGCWAGIAVSLVGAASFDLFTGPQTSLPLWVLAAVGVAAAEEVCPAAPSPLLALARRTALPVLGVVIGSLVFAAAPRTSSLTTDLDLLPPTSDAISTGTNEFVGRTLAHTACTVVTEAAGDGVTSSCFLPFGTVGGATRVRLSADTADAVDAASARVFNALAQRVPSATVVRSESTADARPGWATTAPVAGGALGAAIALLFPAIPMRGRARRLRLARRDADPALVGSTA